MSEIFEGDLVRPLGLVTLYSAYTEGEVDELVAALCQPLVFDERMQQWPVGRKLAFARRRVRGLKADRLIDLARTLEEARALFETRNSFIHGRLYSGGRLISNRKSVPERRITPDELLELAENMFACKEHLSMNRQKHLLPTLSSLNLGGSI